LESDIYMFPVDGDPLDNVRDAKRITWQTGQVQVPTASPRSDEVAYLSDIGGHSNVWIARVDGSVLPRQATDEEDPGVVIGLPLWSPRGDYIAYYKQRGGGGAELWLVEPQTLVQRRLTATSGGASWSHDGEWIFHMSPSDTSAVWRGTEKINVDSGESIPVRADAAGVVVASDGHTAYFSPSTARQGEVWKATPVESGAAIPLRDDLQSRVPMWPHHYHLSSDNRWLATPLIDRGTTNLWTIATTDGSLRQVTDFGQRATMIGRQVSWSSDDRYIFAALLETDADVVLLEGMLR